MDKNENLVKEFNLIDIFSNNKYIIPIYQRNYAWEKDEIEQLLTDIYDSDNKYYLGNLIVDEANPNEFYVIDGQQRLTTIFLLLSYLEYPNLSNALTFEAREKSNITLRELSKNITKSDFYSQEIIDGYNIIENFFKEKEEKERNFKENFESKLLNISIIRTQVPKNIDLNHYFEIMNTRGEQLEIHEIAKGRILSIIDKEKPEYRAMVALIWDNCAKMDSYIQMNFDKTSRKKLFGDEWGSFLCKDINKLCEILEKDENNGSKFSLLEKLENTTSQTKIDFDKKDEDKENERFEAIVSFPHFLLIVNEAMQNNKEDDTSLDDKKFIKILETHWKNAENALNFIFHLLKFRFLFDKYIIKREFAKEYKEEGKWSLQKLQKYFDEKQKQEKPSYALTYQNDEKTQILRILQSALRVTYTSPKTMHWIAKALFELNENESINLTEILEKYACEKIKQSDYKDKSGFGFDRIIFTYLDYVLIRDKKVKNMTIENFQFQFRNSIEHFYPQNPTEKDKWDNGNLNSFGNLALITVSGNSKFSNLDPQAKVATYPSIIKQSPKLQLMSEKANNWIPEIAQEHEKEMLELLEQEIQTKLKFQ
ncbi:DUF262 domain-containing HNH endonuclease family protein [Campylobacter sp. JMF_01 NE2]|uniref:DUF262 domain-containing protein n=1 Tax=unclassified Campylobacter TaxID=2593542 RepID=UPI0022E9E292|nr:MULTISPECIES: DUF262 domain-containing HNH endonuclease family protein [unclassified Campylobacter]MDA3052841.1 DUF262 domain-containing HNH endonuclease family protein [Campylobacter sp. JMF_03 NE3]MDA3067172.1 DUF262 domain-containing HNH endonuclease family protein [Campylobacter sp. JMF_01 NE2]